MADAGPVCFREREERMKKGGEIERRRGWIGTTQVTIKGAKGFKHALYPHVFPHFLPAHIHTYIPPTHPHNQPA